MGECKEQGYVEVSEGETEMECCYPTTRRTFFCINLCSKEALSRPPGRPHCCPAHMRLCLRHAPQRANPRPACSASQQAGRWQPEPCRALRPLLQTLAGRRRYLPNINSKSGAKRAAAERQAKNTICQVGLGAGSCWNGKDTEQLSNHLHARKPAGRMGMYVHAAIHVCAGAGALLGARKGPPARLLG